MSETLEEIEAYRYILRLAEDLLLHAGIPDELKKKYNLVKDITMNKIRSNALKTDGNRISNNFFDHLMKSNIDLRNGSSNGASNRPSNKYTNSFSMDEINIVFDLIFSSYGSINERITNLMLTCSTFDKKLTGNFN